MKTALILNSGYAYFQRFQEIAKYLESKSFTVDWFNDISIKHKSYDILLVNSLQLLNQVCNTINITAHLLCIPAIYDPLNCPINDLNNIETIKIPELDLLLEKFKNYFFI